MFPNSLKDKLSEKNPKWFVETLFSNSNYGYACFRCYFLQSPEKYLKIHYDAKEGWRIGGLDREAILNFDFTIPERV